MYSTYSYSLVPHPTSFHNNSPHFPSDSRGPSESNRSSGCSMQVEPFNCVPLTVMPMSTPTPSTYELQTTDNVSYYYYDPSAPLAQWGCDTDRYLVPDSRPPFFHLAKDDNQVVPVNRTDPQSDCGARPEIVGSAPVHGTYEAPIQGPSYSPVGFGAVHPNNMRTERRRRALDARYVNAAKEITKIMSGVHASQYFRTILTDDVATHCAKLNAYIATLDLDVQAWIINCQTAPPSHQPEKCKDKKKNEDYDRLFCCLWCNSTFTAKHNLANHIRSHMDLHISFCDYCDFSSVCSTLPTRHKCTI